jgi:hypothetical protein
MNRRSIRWQREEARRALCCVLMSAACRQATPAESVRPSVSPSAPASDYSVPPANAAAPVAAEPDLAASGGSGQPSTAAQKPTLSAEQTLEVLIDSKFPSLAPDEAKRKLALVGDVSEKRFESSASVDLYMISPGRQFVVEYVFDSSRKAWVFSDATARADAAEANAAAALYREHEQVLRKRFGKPAWSDNAGAEPVAGWSVGDAGMEVSLRQQRGEQGEYGIQLHYGEVQGEGE